MISVTLIQNFDRKRSVRRASQSLVPLWPDDFIDHLIMTLTYHQTLHFFLGFIGEPRGQLKAFENSGEFINVPLTL